MCIRDRQWTGQNIKEIMQFTTDKDNIHIKDGELLVSTLEGDMKASVGDYIIKGLRGEYYPCLLYTSRCV